MFSRAIFRETEGGIFVLKCLAKKTRSVGNTTMKKLTSISANVSLIDGKVVFKNRRYFDGMLSTFENEEKCRLTLEKERGTRTQQQNRYYWFCLTIIAEHCGYLPEELHEVFRSKFLKTKKVYRGGELTVLKSTTSLTSIEFGEYIEQCRREGFEMNCITPDADKEYLTHEQFPESVK